MDFHFNYLLWSWFLNNLMWGRFLFFSLDKSWYVYVDLHDVLDHFIFGDKYAVTVSTHEAYEESVIDGVIQPAGSVTSVIDS